MVSVDGDADAAVEARIRVGWNKFRQLVPLLNSRNISLIGRGRLCSCVQSSMLYGSETWRVRKDKSSAVAEIGDRGHNRHMGLKEGVLCPFHGALGSRLIQCGLCRGQLPYQVASSSIQPFGQNSVACHLPRKNISTNYYLVVEMHTVTLRSDDVRCVVSSKLTA